MEKNIFILFVIFATATPKSLKHYRSDYVYNERTNSFYKLHTVERSSSGAEDICREEGAELMLPSSFEDLVQVHSMFKPFTDLGEYVWVAPDGEHHESAEEPGLITFPDLVTPPDNMLYECNVVNRKGAIESMGCWKPYPFVCKVEAKNAPYDPHCGTFGRNYHYESTVGSCYRLSNIAYSWDEAYSECRAENAHLVVINSVAEKDVIYRIIQKEREKHVYSVQATFFFYAGFRAQEPVGDAPVVFKTIFNQTLEEAGFAEWSENEPNNAKHNEYCGTIFKNNGKFNDVECAHLYVFICEKEVKDINV